MVRASRHARQRMKERCGLPRKSVDRITERAFNQGITHQETSGSLRKWVDELYLSHETANNIRLYGDKVYLFAEGTLITVIQIPNNLIKGLKKAKLRKEKKEISL